MNIVKPIFIIAPARSGTTILYNLFTRHKETAFFEHFADKFYKSPWKFKFIPLMVKQQMIRFHIRPLPHEGAAWIRYYNYGKYLDESAINDKVKNYIFTSIKAQLRAFKAKRFVNKAIDHCLRVKFLNSLFPDAYFIHIEREPKAVVNSQYELMKKDWNVDLVKKYEHGYKGWVTIKELYGENSSKLETCINYYKHYMDIIKQDFPLIKDKMVTVKYEELTKKPRESMKKLYEFVELQWYAELEKDIPKILTQGNNKKWLNLPDHEKKILEEAFTSNQF